MTSAAERFVLHPIAFAALWIHGSPSFAAAHQLLDDLALLSFHLVVGDDIETHALALLSNDFGTYDVPSPIVRSVFNDVRNLLNQMLDKRVLRVERMRQFLHSAFTIAIRHRISLYDALTVALAERTGLPLLIGDQPLYQTLAPLAAERALLRVTWLPDYRRT